MFSFHQVTLVATVKAAGCGNATSQNRSTRATRPAALKSCDWSMSIRMPGPKLPTTARLKSPTVSAPAGAGEECNVQRFARRAHQACRHVCVDGLPLLEQLLRELHQR